MFQDLGLLMKSGTYPEMPKGTVFNIAVGVLQNNKNISKNGVLTFACGAKFGDDAE